MNDHSDIARVTRDLMNVTMQIEQLAPDVAKAKVAKDYDSDRRKTALAESVVPLMDAGMSASAAEHKARASEAFTKRMKELRNEYHEALTVISRHDALMVKMDALRSVLAVQRATLAI